MGKLISMWVIFYSIIVPIIMAGKPNPARSVRRLQISMIFVVVAWTLIALHWYPILTPVD